MLATSPYLWLFTVLLSTFAFNTQTTLAEIGERENQEYGIGFDFTPSYGAVAVSFANGTNVALGRVDGDRAWHDLMYKVAVDPRNFRKDTIETERVILLDMVLSLAAVGSQALGEPIRSATVSLPAHNRVHHDGEFSVALMMRQAFDAADIEFVKILLYTSQGEPLLFAENSVLAGHGLSICPNYTDNYWCGAVEDRKYEAYILIGYYANALEVTRTADTWTAYAPCSYPFPNHDLGADAKHHNPNEIFYWEAVHDHLIKTVTFSLRANITKVIFYGDHAGDARLRQEVRKVLDSRHQNPDYVESTLDPTFVGALGAAEFVKRAPYARIPRGVVVQPKRDL